MGQGIEERGRGRGMEGRREGRNVKGTAGKGEGGKGKGGKNSPPQSFLKVGAICIIYQYRSFKPIVLLVN